MGNGQCPECEQTEVPWRGHSLDNVGHKKNCPLAAALKEIGGQPLMQGEFEDPRK